MKVGAILISSILIVEKVVFEKKLAKHALKNFIRSNKYIGSKDRKLLYEITFNILKKYHGLLNVCRIHKIEISIRNLVLLNFCYKELSQVEYQLL